MQLTETKLYKELSKRARRDDVARTYLGQIASAYTKIESTLNEIRRTFYHFTDHSIKHSVRIIDRIGCLLIQKQLTRLSSAELYLFIASALVHDIGMVLSQKEIQSFNEDPNFQKDIEEIKYNYKNIFSEDERLSGALKNQGLDRIIIAEYVRRKHAKRSEFVLNDSVDTPCLLLTGCDAELKKWLGRIVAGHCLDYSDILDTNQFPTDVIVGESQHVNIQFLAICLRLGDLLDICTPRADPILLKLTEPLNFISEGHWSQYKDVEIRDLRPRKSIIIAGTCPSQHAERILREWVSWLEEETEKAVVTLNSGCEEYYFLQLGRIDYRIKPELDRTGKPRYEFHNFRFNLDEEKVFKRLFGNRLYGRRTATVREIVQNAVDAVRVRIALECAADGVWRTSSEEMKRKEFHRRLTTKSDSLPITVALEERSSDTNGQPEKWLSICDHGIGMSRDVINKYLLKIGRSRWREDPLIEPLCIGTIGEFGMGFLSVFMISDKVIIETQSCLPNEKGIRAIIYSWRGYLATESIEKEHAGTKISLRLKEEVYKDFDDLENCIRFWCPYLELPIIIRDGHGSEAKLVTKRATRRDLLRRRVYLVDDETNSLVSLRDNKQIKAKSYDSCVSQDGLIIPEVTSPDGNEPSHSILRMWGVQVDLRGKDRVSLDLSRNMVEGGIETFWNHLTQKIWKEIVKKGLIFNSCRKAFFDYYQIVFENSLGKDAIYIDYSKSYYTIPIKDVSSAPIENIVFVDDSSACIYTTVPDICVFLLPKIPNAMFLSHLDTEYAEYLPLNETAIRYWTRLEIHNRYYENETDVKLLETNFQPFDNSFVTLTHYVHAVTSTFRYLRQGENGFSAFSKKFIDKSVLIDTLCVFSLSKTWFALKKPDDGKWVGLNISDLDAVLGIVGKGNLKNPLQFLLCALLYQWPNPHSWDKSWIGVHGEVLQDLVIAAIEKNDMKVVDSFGDWGSYEEDNSDEINEYSDFEDDDLIASKRSKSKDRFYEDEYKRQNLADTAQERAEREYLLFCSNVLDSVNLAPFEPCISKWDEDLLNNLLAIRVPNQ